MSLDETLWGAASPPLLFCYGYHFQIESHCQDTAAGGLAGGALCKRRGGGKITATWFKP